MGLFNSTLTKIHSEKCKEFYAYKGMVSGKELKFNIFINTITNYTISYLNDYGEYVNKGTQARIIKGDQLDSYYLGCFEINGNYYDNSSLIL